MTTQIVEGAQTGSTDIAMIIETTPALILQDAKKKAALFESIEQEIADFVPDLTTDKGRKAIASLAFKVTKTKTAIDSARKLLIEDARKTVEGVNSEWKTVRDRLEELQEAAREPLTKWEEAEAKRAERSRQIINQLKGAVYECRDFTSGDIDDYITKVRDVTFSAETYGDDYVPILEELKKSVVSDLQDLAIRKVKEEQDAAELAALRREREEREAAEAAKREEERLAAEAKAEEETAIEAERQRKEEAAERERIAEENRKAAEKAAEERATLAAQEEARKEREAREASHAAELAAEREKARKLEEAELKRIAEEEERNKQAALRAADNEHKASVMRAAQQSLIKLGVEEHLARQVVIAIKAGEVENVSISF